LAAWISSSYQSVLQSLAGLMQMVLRTDTLARVCGCACTRCPVGIAHPQLAGYLWTAAKARCPMQTGQASD